MLAVPAAYVPFVIDMFLRALPSMTTDFDVTIS
jgi:hypothetical protein